MYKRQVTLVPLSLERHDEIASYVLGLSHFLNLLFARVLATSGLSFAELTAVGSTTFHSQVATTESVVRENPQLYYEIQRSNRFSQRVYRELERAAADWIGWVEKGEPDRFADAMRMLNGWLAGLPAGRFRDTAKVEGLRDVDFPHFGHAGTASVLIRLERKLKTVWQGEQ